MQAISLAWQLVAQLQLRGRWRQAAANSLMRAISADPALYPPYRQLALLVGLPGAEEILRTAVRENAQLPQAWEDLGDILLVCRKFADAELALRRAVLLDPQAAVAWNLLGLAIAEQKERLDEAEACFRRSIAADAKRADPWTDLGHLQQDQLHFYLEAEASYRRALELDPHAAWAWNGLGNVLSRLGRPQEALPAFRRAIAEKPEEILPYENLARVQGDGLHDAAAAEQTYREALERDPNHWRCQINLAFLLAQREEVAAAEEACRRAIQLDSSESSAWGLLARLLWLDAERKAEAEQALRRAIELAPEDPIPRENLVLLLASQLGYRDLGREAEAVDQEFLEEWQFRTGVDAEVVWVTHFGDLFLKKPDGVYLLEIYYGTLTRVADDLEMLHRKLETGELDHCLRRKLFAELEAAGRPAPDRLYVYGFRVAPVFLGVEEDAGNIELEPAPLLLSRMADLMRQLDGVPAGAKVELTVDWKGFLDKFSSLTETGPAGFIRCSIRDSAAGPATGDRGASGDD